MTQEKKKTPEEMLQEAQRMIGNETKPVANQYPVEYESIRRYCIMVDDDNPMFLDPEYAKKTKHGGVILPPFATFGIMSGGSPAAMARWFDAAETPIMPPAPGKFVVNMAQEWEWSKTVMVGDRLTSKVRLADVYMKPIRLDPKAFWVVVEMIIGNQRGETVCTVRNVLLLHRSPEEVAADQPHEGG